MPNGLVRSGDFRKGTPLNLPHQFGNLVSNPEPFGNVIPSANSSLNSNPVTWLPSPNHFGNTVGFSIQTVSPVVVIAPGATGTTNIIVTPLMGVAASMTLAYSGAPMDVTIVFAPNPDTGIAVATVIVGSNVPTGKYAITITGTSGTEIDSANIYLVVAGQTAPTPPSVALVAHTAIAGATTGAINTTNSNFIVIWVAQNGSAVSDNKGNMWTQVGALNMWYAASPVVGSGHTFTTTVANNAIAVAAFSGLAASPFESSAALAVGSNNTVTANSVTPNSIGDLIIEGLVAAIGTPPAAINDSFNILDTAFGAIVGVSLAYLITPSTSAVTPTWTVTSAVVIDAASAVFAV